MSTKQHKRVLVVDDDRQILDSIVAALEARGYDVLAAHDGDEGLMRAERDVPDVIVLDMMMPRRSGLGVLEKLHCEQPGRPKVIFVTANDDQRYRNHARSKGASAFLRKPFQMEELLSTIEQLLGQA